MMRWHYTAGLDRENGSFHYGEVICLTHWIEDGAPDVEMPQPITGMG